MLRGRENGRPSILYRAGNQRARLRQLSSANLGDERIRLGSRRPLARHRWQRSGIRRIRRFELPEPAAGQGKLAFASAQTRPVPDSAAWPPKNADGSPKPVEFTIEVVRDPTGCNTSREYGLKSAQPTVSVYRRPRPAANLEVRCFRWHADRA